MHRTRVELVIPVQVAGERHEISTTLLWPSFAAQRPAGVMVTVPGGTYDRSYWDLQVPGYSTYSFAEYALARGWIMLLMDNLGTGASSRPGGGTTLTVAMMADAVAQTATTLSGWLREGSVDGLPALPDLHLIGAGHSLGGQILAAAQAAHGPFARIALLGSSFLGNAELGVDASREQAAVALRAMSGDTWESGFLHVPRNLLQEQFHAPDVPDAVLRAEEPGQTVLPREAGIAAIAPALLGPVAAGVRVPVFLAYADRDISPDPYGEAANFTGSRDITLFRLAGSAHCHNAAGTRLVLWDRLLAWAAGA